MGDAILAALVYILNGLEEFAKSTSTKWDDLAVDIVRVFMESEAGREWIAGRLNEPEGAMSISDAPEEVKQAFAHRNIPWDKVIEYLPMILALLRTLLNK